MLKKILDFVYPAICGICEKVIKEGVVCNKCISILKMYVKDEKFHRYYTKHFDELCCLYKYEGIIRNKILQYKFYNKKYLYSFFAKNMVHILYKYHKKFDIIVPVPISKGRFAKRGYNQSKLLASGIAMEYEMKVQDILIKFIDTKAQSVLTRRERFNNVRGVYKLKKKVDIKGKTVLLVDDIYTTGATIDECSRVLKNSGAKYILAITIARGI